MMRPLSRPPLHRVSRSVLVFARYRQFFWKAEEIDNTGSIARDLLATERTFLAWARTGLGFVGAGTALAAAYHRNDAEHANDVLPASALLIANGSFLLIFATRRYLAVGDALRRDKFPVNTSATLAAVLCTAVNTTASLAILYAVEAQREAGNKDEET